MADNNTNRGKIIGGFIELALFLWLLLANTDNLLHAFFGSLVLLAWLDIAAATPYFGYKYFPVFAPKLAEVFGIKIPGAWMTIGKIIVLIGNIIVIPTIIVILVLGGTIAIMLGKEMLKYWAIVLLIIVLLVVFI